MFCATVDDVSFLSATRKCSNTSTNFRNHTAINFATDNELLCLFKGKSRDEATFITVVGVNTTHVSEHQKFFSFQSACNFASYAVSIDVVGFTTATNTGRSDYRNEAIGQKNFNQFGVNVFNIANIANVYQINFAIFINVCQMFFSLYQISVFAVQANSTTTQHIQTSYKVSVDFTNQSHFCDANGFSVSYTQTANEFTFFASLHEHCSNFRTAAMNYNGTHTCALQEYDVLQNFVFNLVIEHCVTAVFNNDGFIFKITQIRKSFN